MLGHVILATWKIPPETPLRCQVIVYWNYGSCESVKSNKAALKLHQSERLRSLCRKLLCYRGDFYDSKQEIQCLVANKNFLSQNPYVVKKWIFTEISK